MTRTDKKIGGVEFRSVSRRYGKVTAVDRISFKVEPGTLVTLLGPSGCGKTTTLRMIAGLEAPSDGQILIGGRDVTLLPATDRDVTMVFQSYALFPHMTSVYVTHDQEEALAVSDRIIVMNRAVIAQEGTPADLYRRPVSRFVADFMGISNLLDGTVTGRADGRVTVRFGEAVLTLPDRGAPADEITVAVRPQAIRLAAEAGPDRLPVTVRKATYLGSHLEYVLDSSAGELFVVDPTSDKPVPPGSGAWATFREEGVALVPRGD